MDLPEGTLYPRGFLPMWTEARDAEQAVYGLSYILQQIQATDTYRPNIGQISAAMSSLEFAIRALSSGAPSPKSEPQASAGNLPPDDLPETSRQVDGGRPEPTPDAQTSLATSGSAEVDGGAR